MGFWSDLVKQGPGWDIHDVYDWLPGVESGEEKARMAALKRGYENVPAPPGITPEVRGYMDRLQEMSGRPLGEGYMQSPLYRGLMSDVEQRSRQMGWANSAQQGRSGIMSGPGYGPGQQQATERMEAVGRLQQQAGRQAWDAQVQVQVLEFQNLLAAAGFASDIYSADWEQRFRYAAQQLGWPEAQIQAGVERQRQLMDLGGAALQAVGLYYKGGGGGGGGGVGGSGPGGGRSGLLPSSVG